MPPKPTLTERVREALQEIRGNDLEDLAERVGCSGDSLYRFRRGAVRAPNSDLVEALAVELDIQAPAVHEQRANREIPHPPPGQTTAYVIFDPRQSRVLTDAPALPKQLFLNEDEARLIVDRRRHSTDPFLFVREAAHSLSMALRYLPTDDYETQAIAYGALQTLQLAIGKRDTELAAPKPQPSPPQFPDAIEQLRVSNNIIEAEGRHFQVTEIESVPDPAAKPAKAEEVPSRRRAHGKGGS